MVQQSSAHRKYYILLNYVYHNEMITHVVYICYKKNNVKENIQHLPVTQWCSSFNPDNLIRVPVWMCVIPHPWQLDVGELCLPTELRSWWGRWVILAFEGEEAFSCFTHYNCAEAWRTHSSCLIEIMVRWTSNRTSFWKTAWLKTKLP